MKPQPITVETIQNQVRQALDEDIGTGDLTAALIPENQKAIATIVSRETAIFCGQAWCDIVFQLLDPQICIDWYVTDGDRIEANQALCTLHGPARALLTGERTALNFMQTLSATATVTHQYVEQVRDYPVKVLDTRKTLPMFRLAQKYAVQCGGGYNHRFGLYDAILIKENHILAAGSISNAITKARQYAPGIPVEIEVETLDELKQACETHADIVLLDNFSLEALKHAVEINQGRCQLEASGNIDLDSIKPIAQTGVDRISIGALTKNIQAIDLSMRFQSL